PVFVTTSVAPLSWSEHPAPSSSRNLTSKSLKYCFGLARIFWSVSFDAPASGMVWVTIGSVAMCGGTRVRAVRLELILQLASEAASRNASAREMLWRERGIRSFNVSWRGKPAGGIGFALFDAGKYSSIGHGST